MEGKKLLSSQPTIKEEIMDAKTEVQRYLDGAEYPASRNELAATAQDNDAPADFVKTLLGLGTIEFSDPEEVVEELERLRDPSQNRPLGG